MRRFELEIGVLETQGFTNLLLDRLGFHRLGEKHQIPVGPGRGSAAGSDRGVCDGDHGHRPA
jgi:DNA polymerase III alpha subunit